VKANAQRYAETKTWRNPWIEGMADFSIRLDDPIFCRNRPTTDLFDEAEAENSIDGQTEAR
jgi:hypothetical protein